MTRPLARFSFTIFPSRLFPGGAFVAPLAGAARSFLGLDFASIEKAVIWNVALAPSVDTIDPVPLRPRKTGAGAETAAEWNYNDVLDTYSDWLLSRRADGWEVVDLHGPLNRYLAERRRTEPAFTMARDGVHPGDEGHWLMAREILKHLGAGKAAEAPDAAALLAGRKGGPEAFKLVQQRMGLLRDAWLTQTGHKRPGMSKGQPLEQAQERAGELGRRIGALLTE